MIGGQILTKPMRRNDLATTRPWITEVKVLNSNDGSRAMRDACAFLRRLESTATGDRLAAAPALLAHEQEQVRPRSIRLLARLPGSHHR